MPLMMAVSSAPPSLRDKLTFVRQRKLLLVPPEPRKRDLELAQPCLCQRFIPHHIMRRQHNPRKLCQSLDTPR